MGKKSRKTKIKVVRLYWEWFEIDKCQQNISVWAVILKEALVKIHGQNVKEEEEDECIIVWFFNVSSYATTTLYLQQINIKPIM
jgi:hypothetical protein